MRAWRRSLSTSVTRYNHSSSLASRKQLRLRCAELLNASGADNNSQNKYENEEITLEGFVRSVRKQKRFAFAEISDGSTVKSLQAILTPEQGAAYVSSRGFSFKTAW